MHAISNISAIILFLTIGFFSCQSVLATEEVLVYYANETSPESEELESWHTIIQWLESSEEDVATGIAEQLHRDMTEFASIVDDEIDAIIHRCRAEQRHAILFTNRWTRQQKCLLIRGGESGFIAFQPPDYVNQISQSNPLSMADSLREALELCAEQFSAEDHNFTLVVKSHGSTEYAMTPRLVISADQTSELEVVDLATGRASLPEVVRSGVATSKRQFLDTLIESGSNHGMQFELVFIEACQGDFPDDRVYTLPANVNTLITTGRASTGYVNVDYEMNNGSWSQVVSSGLNEQFAIFEQHAEWHQVIGYALMLPLIAFAGCLLVQRFRRPGEAGHAHECEL